METLSRVSRFFHFFQDFLSNPPLQGFQKEKKEEEEGKSFIRFYHYQSQSNKVNINSMCVF